MNRSRASALLMLALAFVTAAAAGPAGADEPAQRARVRQDLIARLGPRPLRLDDAALNRLWVDEQPLLDAVVQTIALFRPDVRRWLEELSSPAAHGAAPIVPPGVTDPVVKTNLALYLAMELLRHDRSLEALELLREMPASHVADPATYCFGLGSCHFALQQKQQALAALQRLLQRKDVPRRYRALAEQMQAALASLERESLAGIAHDMRQLGLRLARHQADARVRERQADVVSRLDALIAELEARQGQAAQSGAASSSARPAAESLPLGGKGEGKVARRTFARSDPWGNLPEKEREKAMQTLGRQFPARYRDAVEQYFRKLAEQQ